MGAWNRGIVTVLFASFMAVALSGPGVASSGQGSNSIGPGWASYRLDGLNGNYTVTSEQNASGSHAAIVDLYALNGTLLARSRAVVDQAGAHVGFETQSGPHTVDVTDPSGSDVFIEGSCTWGMGVAWNSTWSRIDWRLSSRCFQGSSFIVVVLVAGEHVRDHVFTIGGSNFTVNGSRSGSATYFALTSDSRTGVLLDETVVGITAGLPGDRTFSVESGFVGGMWNDSVASQMSASITGGGATLQCPCRIPYVVGAGNWTFHVEGTGLETQPLVAVGADVALPA